MPFLVSAGVLIVLVWLAVVDWRSYRLPDTLTLPLAAAGVVLAGHPAGIGLGAALLGAGLGFGTFWIIGEVYFRRTGREGLGLGDAKLFGASGAWLGPAALPWVLLIAAVAGLALALARPSDLRRALPFGPCLCLGSGVVYLASPLGAPFRAGLGL